MKLRLFSLIFIALLLAAPVALAANPHFVSIDPSIANSGSLQVKFKEAGLGANQSILYLLRANGSAVWGCKDKSGNIFNIQPAFSMPIEKRTTLTASKNGSISATVTLAAPRPAALTCAAPAQAFLLSVQYNNGGLADYTNGLVQLIPDQSATY